MKKILIIGYSQLGQTQKALEYFEQGLKPYAQCDYVNIIPTEEYKFPWSLKNFFRVFPQCVQGIAPHIKLNSNLQKINWDAYDLIILGAQVWFLSPSLPVQGFLNSPYAQNLKNKNVITVMTCRNLYVSACQKIKSYLKNLNAQHLGDIIVCEKSPVWASFITTPRWLLTGKKNAFAFFPEAGIDENEFIKLEHKGKLLGLYLDKKNDEQQFKNIFGSNLNKKSLFVMDKIGITFFKFWSKLILTLTHKQGFFQDALLVLFRINLILIVVCVAPLTKIFDLKKQTRSIT